MVAINRRKLPNMVVQLQIHNAHQQVAGAEKWSVDRAAEVYGVDQWGKGYFRVNAKGHLCVHPTKQSDRYIDLMDLIGQLQERGIGMPVLIRFADILRHRLGELHTTFRAAIKDLEYKGNYSCVYPIKVNQQGQVVEEVLKFGQPFGFGLEAGSKPELLAVIAISDNSTPIICNGFKDTEYIEAVMWARKIGRQVLPVVEKFSDLELIIEQSRRLGVRPQLGMRVKLASMGSGRWQESGGYRSKFGLTVTEILEALALLKSEGLEESFELLHFHLGSQITNIRHIKGALTEAARIYVELARQGAGLKYLDVGGGLGVDYDGSQTNFESSVNYTLDEYARDVVYHIQTVCDEAGIAHPTIISESGRAVVAYHAALVFNVLGVLNQGITKIDSEVASDAEQPLIDLSATYKELNVRNLLESFHDAQQALDMAMHLFSAGYLPLEQRAVTENLFWAICRKIRSLAGQLHEMPEELEGLDSFLSDSYFCNFSVFQSMPDSWAIGQLFPIMPIHRLDERPVRNGTLCDITCDSDGKVDRFVDRRDVKRTLPLHSTNEEPYYLGAFLVGAYQEILGDLHNLFGDSNAVHVSLNDNNEPELDAVIQGDTVREVLEYVEFDANRLRQQLAESVEASVADGRITADEAKSLLKFFEDGLDGYTYLENFPSP